MNHDTEQERDEPQDVVVAPEAVVATAPVNPQPNSESEE